MGEIIEVMVPGTRRSIRTGIRKMFMPVSARMSIADLSGVSRGSEFRLRRAIRVGPGVVNALNTRNFVRPEFGAGLTDT